MSDPFFDDRLSDINENDSPDRSRLSLDLGSQKQLAFEEDLSFAQNLLSTWGIHLGEMALSSNNQVMLRVILELAQARQKDLQFRSRAKDELNSLQFDCDKYRSFMQQAQRLAQEHAKRIGRLENENAELKSHARKVEGNAKKEKEEDRKMIANLRTKNEQMLHQLKKREQDLNRMKEQLKKGNGDKVQNRNSFEVYQAVASHPQSKNSESDVKYGFILERNERQLTQMVKENSLMREKIFEINELLGRLNHWIDHEIFGEVHNSHLNKVRTQRFYLNHNLIFKKESITQQLLEMIETTKNGLLQLRQICRESKSPRKMLPELKPIESLSFMKKSKGRQEPKTDRMIRSQFFYKEEKGKEKMVGSKKLDRFHNENQTPPAKIITQVQPKAKISIKLSEKREIPGNKSKMIKSAPMNLSPTCNIVSTLQNPCLLSPFTDEVLSDVDNQESSIISHISMEQLGKSSQLQWEGFYQDDKF